MHANVSIGKTKHQSPSVLVEKNETPDCCLCLADGKKRKAKYVMKVVHYYGWLGLVAKGCYCEQHCKALAAAFNDQMRKE
jgi:hypothetical protein